MFEVIREFKDIEDGHIYKKGDIYPFDARTINDIRIQELSSKNNRLKTKLIIERVKEPKEPKKTKK
jgi:hypothetical protein